MGLVGRLWMVPLSDGKDLVTYSEKELCNIRGNDVSMIFQEPMTSLNPVLTIGEQITEILIYHKNFQKEKRPKSD